MEQLGFMRMSKDVTPPNSPCPVYLDDAEPEKIAALIAENKAQADALAARTVAREALLTKLGITAEEAQLLLGGM